MNTFLKEHKNQILVIGIFVVFAIFLLFQHQFLYLYHDDYGYASLSYIQDSPPNIEGTNFSLSDILNFLNKHYFTWGGRVLAYFFEIAILHYLGLGGFRIFQAIMILGIFIMIYKIMSKILDRKVPSWILALVTVSLYGVTEILTFHISIFWISASISYVIPIFFFLLFVYLYSFRKKEENESTFKKIFYNSILVLSMIFATFSQEQIGVASLMYIATWTVYHFIKDKKISKLDILFTVVSLISFAILMLAPGNEIRKQDPTSLPFYSQPFLERTAKGIAETIAGNFGNANRIFSVFFFGIALIAGARNIQKNIGLKSLNILNLISTSGILLMFFTQEEGYFSYAYNLFDNNIYKVIILGVTLLQLALIAYSITINLWNRNRKEFAFLFWGAILSQGAMAVAPYFPLRSTIIFEYIFYLIGIDVIAEIYDKNKIIVSCIVIPFLLVCIINMAKITKGYWENDEVNLQNHMTLLSAEEEIEKGNKVDKIELNKLPNIECSAAQPYEENFDYILWWIKEYYNLPYEIDIQYN